MQHELLKLRRRFLELDSLLADPQVMADSQSFCKLNKERSDLQPIIETFDQLEKYKKEKSEAEQLSMHTADADMRQMAEEELVQLEQKIGGLEQELALMLLPKDPNDGKSLYLEVRAGAGGDEASLFAGELFRAYLRYASTCHWKTEVMSVSENEMGGMKEAIARVDGAHAYSCLKFESGVHRVQRVPKTEAQGRVHTSTVTVAILPEAEDVDITVNESDLRVDTYRASGAGGQHVNRTDSAVRITHLPTGLVVACQDERSQIKNRSKAMKILQSKLLDAAQSAQDKAFSQERKLQVGTGDRSERLRTYNFPQSRITDHRINESIHSIDDFMEGDMEPLLCKLRAYDRMEALAQLSQGKPVL